MQFDLLQNDLLPADEKPATAVQTTKTKPHAAPRKSTAEILSELESLDPQELLAPLPEEIMEALRPMSESHSGADEPDFDDHELMTASSSEKSPDALKTISEAAQVLEVPQHVLRFWESRFPQIKPVKSRGGRRYYRPEDMKILSTIKHLLYKEGYTIKGAKKAFQEGKRQDAQAALAATVQENATVSMERALQTLEGRRNFSDKQLHDMAALRLSDLNKILPRKLDG